MRLAAAIGTAVLAFFGLLNYELLLLIGVVASIVLGLVNFVRLGRQASVLKALQDSQGERIDRLPDPPEV